MRQEYIVNERPGRPPTHPGSIFKEDILPALGISATQAAAELHVSRQTLHRIMSGEASVTPEMALKLSKFCGSTPSFWLRMQQQWDLWHAEDRLKEELKEIRRSIVLEPHPYKDFS